MFKCFWSIFSLGAPENCIRNERAPTMQTSVNFRHFVGLYLGNVTNFKAFFPAVLMDSRKLVPVAHES